MTFTDPGRPVPGCTNRETRRAAARLPVSRLRHGAVERSTGHCTGHSRNGAAVRADFLALGGSDDCTAAVCTAEAPQRTSGDAQVIWSGLRRLCAHGGGDHAVHRGRELHHGHQCHRDQRHAACRHGRGRTRASGRAAVVDAGSGDRFRIRRHPGHGVPGQCGRLAATEHQQRRSDHVRGGVVLVLLRRGAAPGHRAAQPARVAVPDLRFRHRSRVAVLRDGIPCRADFRCLGTEHRRGRLPFSGRHADRHLSVEFGDPFRGRQPGGGVPEPDTGLRGRARRRIPGRAPVRLPPGRRRPRGRRHLSRRPTVKGAAWRERAGVSRLADPLQSCARRAPSIQPLAEADHGQRHRDREEDAELL